METTKIIEQVDILEQLKELIVRQQIRINQTHSVAESKVWLFYTVEEKEEWYKKFFHTLEIKEAALNRLKQKYINILKSFTNDSNN